MAQVIVDKMEPEKDNKDYCCCDGSLKASDNWNDIWFVLILFAFLGTNWGATPRTENEDIAYLKGQVAAYENILAERKGD